MNGLTARLGIRFPLLQAGMGGIAGPQLAAAVANAGAGGVVALYRMRPVQIVALLRDTAALTSRPFGVNLIPELLDGAALGSQIQAALEASAPQVFFTTFGLPDAAAAARIRDAGRSLLVMVGTADDALRAEALGADAVILQGTEAGGHLLGTLGLRALIDAVQAQGGDIPFLCAGGISHGQEFRTLRELGAAGCLCGTLFVATTESQAHARYKQRLVAAEAQDTLLTDLFDIGWPRRWHRVLSNSLTAAGVGRLPPEFIARTTFAGHPHPIPRYSAMVPTADTTGRIEEMVMYGGTSVSGVHGIVTASERVGTFIAQYAASALAATSADSGRRTQSGIGRA